MSFTLNPFTAIKEKLLAVDLNHNKIPDVYEAIEKAEKDGEAVKAFISHIDAQDVTELFALLPARLKSKIPTALLTSLAAAVEAAPASIDAVESALKTVEADLKK